MTRRVHLLGLVAVVVLLAGSTGAGTVWAQELGAPPCRTTVTGFVSTLDGGVGDSWTVTVVPGLGSNPAVSGNQNHTAKGGLAEILAFVSVTTPTRGTIDVPVTLTPTFDFGGAQVTAPNTMSHSDHNSLREHQLKEACADALGGGLKAKDVTLNFTNVFFEIEASVTHVDGPLIDPPETGTPWTPFPTPLTGVDVTFASEAAFSSAFSLTTPLQ